MDLQSFCVENRRKVNTFSLLRTSVQSAHKLTQSFQFDMPVSEMEEHCFQNMPCQSQLSFHGIPKNSECLTKKTCFDQFNKFSSFSFSRVVGGFVGSKSQGGSATREPHQVWDVILRQLVDTACHTPLNNNLHQYFNIGNAMSHSIFGSVASYIITRPTDFFGSKSMTVDDNLTSANQCQNIDHHLPLSEDILSSKMQWCVQEESVRNMKKSDNINSPKQSYADVAKSHSTSRLDSSFSDLSQRIHSSSVDKRGHRFPRKSNIRERKIGNHCIEHSQSISSQHHLQRKHAMIPDKFDDQVQLKYVRDKHPQHHKPASFNMYKNRPRNCHYQQIGSFPKDSNVFDDKKTKIKKFKNNNMREKERKNIDLQVHEDVTYICNTSEQECENWRCEHNRVQNLYRGRNEYRPPRDNYVKRYTKHARLLSPPPRTFELNSVKNCVQNMEIESPTQVKCKMKRTEISEEISPKCEKSDLNNSVSKSVIEEISESSSNCLPVIITTLSERPRLISEGSIDSEDSCIVFERDGLDVPDDYSEDDSVSFMDSEDDSHSDSGEEDCDEVDFQYCCPSFSSGISSTEICNNTFSPIPDRLKDINERWHEENSYLTGKEKTPTRVHFARKEVLVKVHPMVHWGFAYRKARRGPWEEIGRDRNRFQMRISNAERDLACIFDPEHRRRVWEERMCPPAVA